MANRSVADCGRPFGRARYLRGYRGADYWRVRDSCRVVVSRLWKVEDEGQKQMAQLLFWRNVTFSRRCGDHFRTVRAFGHDLPLTITDPLFDLRD
jgi:hypothetical protein